ncbi:MAG: tRNA pseudouridine(38-40) synthase TruA [Paludibacteraceae bacterium]|nr:tRNA pseudouridine(38-40) synthase TruA [Paludibacteraceae bacterium]
MRYFVYFSYRGTSYHGWQRQQNAMTVQEVMEHCMSNVLRVPITLVGAGRTDAGVHASQMVAHFDMPDDSSPIPKDNILLVGKLNSYLPQDIAIQQIIPVKSDAHARFSALSRTYHYYVIMSKSPFYRMLATHISYPLDFNKMNQAAKLLLETSDFASFCKLHTDVKTTICKVTKAEWTQVDESIWMFSIKSDRFLRDMVRAIVGTLFEVGTGKLTIDDFQRIIDAHDRCAARGSAPAVGLYLSKVEYPNDIF